MTVKEQLIQVRNQECMVRAYEDELGELRRRAYNISSPKMADKVQSNHQSSLEDIVEKLDAQARKVNEAWDTLISMRDDAEALINLEEDMQRRCVIWRYYILGESWEKVAENIHLDMRYVFRIHGRALQDLEFLQKSHKKP